MEFFGIPRLRAGRAELSLPAATLAEVLAAIERECPGLTGRLRENGRLSPHYLLSINGERFVKDINQRMKPGDRILLLSADAGG